MGAKTQFFVVTLDHSPWSLVARLSRNQTMEPKGNQYVVWSKDRRHHHTYPGKVVGERATIEEAIESRDAIRAAQEVMSQ